MGKCFLVVVVKEMWNGKVGRKHELEDIFSQQTVLIKSVWIEIVQLSTFLKSLLLCYTDKHKSDGTCQWVTEKI